MTKIKSPFRALLIKQLHDDFNLHKGKKFDFFGMMINLIISVAIIALVVLVFDTFINMYLAITIDRVADVLARQTEVLTIVYAIVIFAGIFGAMGQITQGLFENEDLKVYVSLPLSPNTIVMSKLIAVYIKQVVTSAVILVPFVIMIGMATQNSWTYYLITSISCLFVPVVSIAIATLLSLPYYVIRKFVRSRFTLNFVLTTLMLGIMFLGYSLILGLLEQVLTAGEIKYVFTSETMELIGDISYWLMPASNFARLCLGQDVFINLYVIFAMTVACVFIAVVVIEMLYTYITNSRLTRSTNISRKANIKQNSIFVALIKKEYNDVYRSHNYSYQYFSVAILMPLMAVLCMSIAGDLIYSLLLVNINFELSIFVVALFGVLTNTFCSTNISREGQLFMCLKAMPLYATQVIYAKVVFCMIVSFLAVFLSAGAIFAFGYITWWQAIVLLFVGTFLSFAQVCFATRLDFKNPQFSNDEDVEIKESNSTISSILFVGLIFAVAMGLAIAFLSIIRGLQGATNTALVTTLCSLGFSILCAGIAIVFLQKGLNKAYAQFTGEKR